MNKIFLDVLIVVGVILAYIVIGAIQPFTNEVIATGNLSANWTGMEASQGAYNAMPIVIWFIPGTVGIVAFVANHKMRS